MYNSELIFSLSINQRYLNRLSIGYNWLKENKKMLIKEKKGVQYISIDEASDGQRVDNFLIKILKKVPKSHIYKILRSG